MGGFQVFDEICHIPIRRLTFFFGPNSAGKSSVQDGLGLLAEFCRSGGADLSWGSGGNTVVKHWRRVSESLDDLAETMVLGCRAIVPSDIQHELREHYQQATGKLSSFGGYPCDATRDGTEIEYRVTFKQSKPKDHSIGRDIATTYEIFLQGEEVLRLEQPGLVTLNFKSCVLKGLDSDLLAAVDIASFDTGNPYACVLDEKLVLVGAGLTNERKLDRSKLLSAWDPMRDGDGYRLTSTDLEDQLDTLRDILPRFADLFDLVLELSLATLNPLLDSAVVPASRTIPTELDLTYFIPRVGVGIDGPFPIHGDLFPLPGTNLSGGGDAKYRSLANSFAAEVRATPVQWDPLPTVQLSQDVNRMLADYLFIERGYRLDKDYRVVLRPEHFELLVSPTKSGKLPSHFSIFLRMFLVDSVGRRFSFEDVGSGLGYVLPVLAACCDVEFKLVVVQQPELHLHPALQASIGDVLIDATRVVQDLRSKGRKKSAGRRLVIETHSEHILLRLLKRIRQTSAGKCPEGLSVSSDEVSIVYFDPHPDGTTKARQIRIADDGEFIDRWPRGFFPERERELFDDGDE